MRSLARVNWLQEEKSGKTNEIWRDQSLWCWTTVRVAEGYLKDSGEDVLRLEWVGIILQPRNNEISKRDLVEHNN